MVDDQHLNMINIHYIEETKKISNGYVQFYVLIKKKNLSEAFFYDETMKFFGLK